MDDNAVQQVSKDFLGVFDFSCSMFYLFMAIKCTLKPICIQGTMEMECSTSIKNNCMLWKNALHIGISQFVSTSCNCQQVGTENVFKVYSLNAPRS